MIDPNTNQIIKNFTSLNEASSEIKVNYRTIKEVCEGKRDLAGGYKWTYRN
jgi:hypothetical protein